MAAKHADEQVKARRKAERRGRFGEHVAALFLMLKGYRIVARRYRAPQGEIDLVAMKGVDLAVFVEVKARASAAAGVDAVSFGAQQRIRAASGHWLARRRDAARLSLRYDIVVVAPGRWPVHFIDAF